MVKLKIKRSPVDSRFTPELETVFFGLVGTENQVDLQGLLWKQSAKTIVRLDLNKLLSETKTRQVGSSFQYSAVILKIAIHTHYVWSA